VLSWARLARSDTLHGVPSLFRRKSADLVAEAVTETEADKPHRKGYTPSKQELGKVTPKRPRAGALREAPPTDRKEAARRARDKERAARAEQRAGMMAGDERYLMARDRGPERALVRDIIDSRRTVGTFFFSFAFVLLVVSSLKALPTAIVLTANFMWLLLGFGVILDSVLVCRKINRLVRERFPKTQQRMGSLYMYAVMRSLSYRRFRMPKPRVKIGDKI
jgi:Protein of unknown function (DUF3043)